MSSNIKTLDRGQFDWADGKRAASLKTVCEQLMGKLDDAKAWYQTKRVGKRRLAWITRISAVVLGTVAAALPTVSEMTRTTDDWLLRPGTATIVGLVAAALLWLDKLIGASSGWIRYTMAETALKELLDELALTYTFETGLWAGQPDPTVEQTKHTLTVLQGFLARANQIVRDETNQWKAEFQSALQQTEELAKVQPKKVEEAVGTVKISNPDRLAGAWWISINGGPEEQGSSDSKSFRLTPGPITVRVKAGIKTGADGTQTRTYTTEASDMLVAGTPKEIRITLPLS